MKTKSFNSGLLVVLTWFTVITIIALCCTSCATGYVQCEAYGKLDYKKPNKNTSGITFEIMTPERAEIAKN